MKYSKHESKATIMSDELVDGDGPRPISKFEWRPEDVTILSDADAALAEAEYREWRARGEEGPTSDPN